MLRQKRTLTSHCGYRVCYLTSRHCHFITTTVTLVIRAQLSLGKVGRTDYAANLNVVSYLHNVQYNVNFWRHLAQNTRVANCGQTATDSEMVTVDSLPQIRPLADIVHFKYAHMNLPRPIQRYHRQHYDVPFSHSS